jgi:hypothetical protein
MQCSSLCTTWLTSDLSFCKDKQGAINDCRCMLLLLLLLLQAFAQMPAGISPQYYIDILQFHQCPVKAQSQLLVSLIVQELAWFILAGNAKH